MFIGPFGHAALLLCLAVFLFVFFLLILSARRTSKKIRGTLVEPSELGWTVEVLVTYPDATEPHHYSRAYGAKEERLARDYAISERTRLMEPVGDDPAPNCIASITLTGPDGKAHAF